MAKIFYEYILLIRHDLSSADVDKIIATIENLISENSGETLKKEYWGLRPLSYQISRNNKAHYCFLAFQGTPAILKALNKKLKFNESIIRSSMHRVNSISKDPSPLLKAETPEPEAKVINVSS